MNIRVFVRGVVILAAALFVPAVRAAIIAADVVNVDFNTTDHSSTTYTGLAAGPATAGTTWNGIDLGVKLNNSAGAGTTHNFGPTTAGALVDSNGAATSLAASLTVTLNDIRQYMTDENAVAAPVGDLLNDYSFIPVDRGGSTLTIGGVPGGGTYDLYLYSENGNYNSATTTFTVSGGPTATATNSGASNTFGQNRNYVEFSGLISIADGSSFTVALTGIGVLNGFQLVQTSVPEPLSLMLVGLSALPLLRRRQAVRV